MAQVADLKVEVLAHQMYLHWCPRCLVSQPFVRIFLRIGQIGTSTSMCLVCGERPSIPIDQDQVD